MEYFTPKIEDIRVNYQCELFHPKNETWDKYILTYEEIHIFNLKKYIEQEKIRVPYLDKIQIEKEGWKYDRNWKDEFRINYLDLKNEDDDDTYLKYYDTYYFNKEKYFLIWQPEVNMIFINNGEYYDNEIIYYSGFCPDINTLRYISKLLNI